MLTPCAAASAGSLRVVALSGDPAPGAPAGAVFQGFWKAPVLNARGEIAFTAKLAIGPGGITAGTETAVFAPDGSGAARLVARTGEVAPDAGLGRTWKFLGTPILNDAGHVVFSGQVEQDPALPYLYFGGGPAGLWSARPGGETQVVIPPDAAAPGTKAGARFGSYPAISMDAAGRLAFKANLDGSLGTNGDETVWRQAPDGRLVLIGQESAQAPGTAPGTLFSFLFGGLRMNASGQLAFLGELRPSLGDAKIGNLMGFWTSEPEPGPQLRLRESAPAPGAPPDTILRLSRGSFPAIDGVGRLAFVGQLRTVNPPAILGGAVFGPGLTGEVSLLAQAGQLAPGTHDAARFETFPQALDFERNPVTNIWGETAFQAQLQWADGSVTLRNDRGIWILDRHGALRLVVREGDPVPGRPGIEFARLVNFFVNARGEVVFLAQLADPSLDPLTRLSLDSGIFYSDGPGRLAAVVQEGDAIEVAPGDTRIIGDLYDSQAATSTNPYGFSFLEESLNERGQLVFRTLLADGTEALVLAQIPEPSTGLLVLSGLLALGARRRGRSGHVRQEAAKTRAPAAHAPRPGALAGHR